MNSVPTHAVDNGFGKGYARDLFHEEVRGFRGIIPTEVTAVDLGNWHHAETVRVDHRSIL